MCQLYGRQRLIKLPRNGVKAWKVFRCRPHERKLWALGWQFQFRINKLHSARCQGSACNPSWHEHTFYPTGYCKDVTYAGFHAFSSRYEAADGASLYTSDTVIREVKLYGWAYKASNGWRAQKCKVLPLKKRK